MNGIMAAIVLASFIVQAVVATATTRSAVMMNGGRAYQPFYTDPLLQRRTLGSTEFQVVLSSSNTRFVPTSKGNSFDAQMKTPIMLTADDVAATRKDEVLLVYLGSKNNIDYVAVDFPEDSIPPILQREGIKATVLRNFAEDIEDRYDAALLAYARGMTVWHNNCKHCSRCGSKTVPQRNGASRKCTNESCKASSYPRIEPATMMLITTRCDSHVLLGRKKEWPVGRYSVLAGFTEVGESLEETAVRETYEESGVRVDPSTLRFVTSQPWPFPHSLMIGFFGQCVEDGIPTINFDPKEMEVRLTHTDRL
jgi:NAD+ diphosphatase